MVLHRDSGPLYLPEWLARVSRATQAMYGSRRWESSNGGKRTEMVTQSACPSPAPQCWSGCSSTREIVEGMASGRRVWNWQMPSFSLVMLEKRTLPNVQARKAKVSSIQTPTSYSRPVTKQNNRRRGKPNPGVICQVRRVCMYRRKVQPASRAPNRADETTL